MSNFKVYTTQLEDVLEILRDVLSDLEAEDSDDSGLSEALPQLYDAEFSLSEGIKLLK